MTAYPILENMMSSYFHQDYDLMGDSDAEIIHDFASHQPTAGRIGAVAEIDLFLSEPNEGLLRRFTKATGEWNMTIADDDLAAREWLIMARGILVAQAD